MPRSNERLDRETVKVKGDGQVKVDFDVPREVQSGAVRVAAWIGETYESNLQYINTGPIPVK